MEAIIQNHPEGIAVICANNDDMARRSRNGAPSAHFKRDVRLCLLGQVALELLQTGLGVGGIDDAH